MTFVQFFQANLLLFLLLGAVIVAIIIYEWRNRGSGGRSVSPSEAAQISNRGGRLIDLRSAVEYKKGHIAGAKNIPAEHFEQKMTASKGKPDCTIVLIDQNGMGAKAKAQWLLAQGYSDVCVLSGGLAGWEEENLPLVK